MIHSTAIIHPQAKLHPTVQIGPYAVIDAGVELGADCRIGPHVYLTGQTTIGQGNQFHAGCVIGDAPQDFKYQGAPTELRIGDNNVFREHFTVHRSTLPAEATVIGSNNFLMAHAHIGHNCVVGNHVIMANGALLGGHAVVEDRAFISGNCLVHQFARVGTLAMMRGGAAISKDLPPFCVALGENTICGLNTVGLRRAEFAPPQRRELKRLYHELFRAGINLRAAVAGAREKHSAPAPKIMLDFITAAKRGVCTDRGGGRRDQEED
jgi:UDP-N-acetylglucosamine acyltransferase